MAIINLRDYYPFYTSDCFMEVSEEVAEMFKEFDRKEAAYRLRTYRHKAYYSLDRDDGLEHEAVFVALSPHELYERKVTMQELHAAIASLPNKQAKRIYAHFILGMTKQDIARAEGVHEKVVRVAIERGLRRLEKIYDKFFAAACRTGCQRCCSGNFNVYSVLRYRPSSDSFLTANTLSDQPKGRLFSGQFYYSAGNSPGCTDCNGAHDNIVWPNCSDLDNYRTRNNGTVGKSFSGYGGKDLLSASLWLCNGRNNAGGTVAGRGGKRPCPALRTLV